MISAKATEHKKVFCRFHGYHDRQSEKNEKGKRTMYEIRVNYNLCLSDAFEEAVKNYPKLKKGSELWKAWYYCDFRKYIPSAYIPESLDFRKYPLRYSA